MGAVIVLIVVALMAGKALEPASPALVERDPPPAAAPTVYQVRAACDVAPTTSEAVVASGRVQALGRGVYVVQPTGTPEAAVSALADAGCRVLEQGEVMVGSKR